MDQAGWIVGSDIVSTFLASRLSDGLIQCAQRTAFLIWQYLHDFHKSHALTAAVHHVASYFVFLMLVVRNVDRLQVESVDFTRRCQQAIHIMLAHALRCLLLFGDVVVVTGLLLLHPFTVLIQLKKLCLFGIVRHDFRERAASEATAHFAIDAWPSLLMRAA